MRPIRFTKQDYGYQVFEGDIQLGELQLNSVHGDIHLGFDYAESFNNFDYQLSSLIALKKQCFPNYTPWISYIPEAEQAFTYTLKKRVP